MAQMAADGQLAKLIGPANAAADAQNTASGLGIQNVRRCVALATLGGGSNVTVANATAGFAPLSTPLSVDVVLSGRPLVVFVAGKISAGNGGDLKLSVRLRGQEITGLDEGIPGLYHSNGTGGLSPQGVSGFWPVLSPGEGRATIDVVADATTADGFVYVAPATSNAALLLVFEL